LKLHEEDTEKPLEKQKKQFESSRYRFIAFFLDLIQSGISKMP